MVDMLIVIAHDVVVDHAAEVAVDAVVAVEDVEGADPVHVVVVTGVIVPALPVLNVLVVLVLIAKRLEAQPQNAHVHAVQAPWLMGSDLAAILEV